MFLHNNLPTLSDWPMFVSCIRWLLIGACLPGVVSCTVRSGPKSEIVVSVKDQKLGLYHEGVLQKQYAISTSKFGLGDQLGSYKTPLGNHEVIAKIGHGLPTGAVLKSRSWNGEVLKPNAPGRDPIVSRILWLRGMETDNSNAMKRFIYIHGTTEEGRLGKPASFGCIRMGMSDVIDLFNDVNIGAKVEITKNRLPKGAEKLDPPAVIEPTDPAQIASGPPQPPKAAVTGKVDIPKEIEAKVPSVTESLVKDEKTVVAAAATQVESEAISGNLGQKKASEAAFLVSTGPVPVQDLPKRKQGGWFGLFSKKPREPALVSIETTAEQAMVRTTDAEGPVKIETVHDQVAIAVNPPSNMAASGHPRAPSQAVQTEVPRKKRGFFGFFKRSSAVPQAIAAVAEEKVSPERSDMKVTAQPVSPEGSMPRKQDASGPKSNAPAPKAQKAGSTKADEVRVSSQQVSMPA